MRFLLKPLIWLYEKRKAYIAEEKARRQEIIDFYKEKDELMPPVMYCYMTGCMRESGYPLGALFEEFKRIGEWKKEKARQAALASQSDSPHLTLM